MRSPDFLNRVWFADGGWGRPAQTAEFHWTGRQGNAILTERHWTGEAGECPACVTQAVMTAYYHSKAREVHVRLSDETQRAMDFRLVSAGSKSAEFVSVAGAGHRTYQLNYELLPEDILVVSLERSEFASVSTFSRVARWRFHRPSLIHPS